MIDTTIFPGDVIRARYYAVQKRTTKRGETIAELATKTGNFIVLDTRIRTPYVHALISLRNITEKDKHLPCFAYNKDYHVILNLRYKIEIVNIDAIIFSMGDTPEFLEIKKIYNKYRSCHSVRDVGEYRKVSNKKRESEYSNGFHMGYVPTTSVRIIRGGSFGKK